MNARAFFSGPEVVGARANKRRKQLANKDKGTLAESSFVYSGQSQPLAGVTPPTPTAAASVVPTTRSLSPILPSHVQMVVPRFEEVIQSDQIQAKWSFSGICVPSEIIRHSIANTVQTMITLNNLSESIELLKKDKEDACCTLMSKIDTIRGERNSCRTELKQLKSSSCTKINQLKVKIDRL